MRVFFFIQKKNCNTLIAAVSVRISAMQLSVDNKFQSKYLLHSVDSLFTFISTILNADKIKPLNATISTMNEESNGTKSLDNLLFHRMTSHFHEPIE